MYKVFIFLVFCLFVTSHTATAQSIGAFGGGATSFGRSGHSNPILHETRRLTSPFGQRSGRLHAGVDMAACRGGEAPQIAASAGGEVMYSGYVSGYGQVVDVYHGGGMRTRYAHLSRRLVSPGQAVSTGRPVGVMGSSGGSYAMHLHYETHTGVQPDGPFNTAQKGGAGQEQNPCGYLPDCQQMQQLQANYNDTGCGMPFDQLPTEDYEPHAGMLEIQTDHETLDYSEAIVWEDDYEDDAEFSSDKCKYKTDGVVPITIELPACEVTMSYTEPVAHLEAVSSPSFSNLVNNLPSPEGEVFNMLDDRYGTSWRGSSRMYLNQRQPGFDYYYTHVLGITPKARFDSSGSDKQVKQSLSCDIAEYAWQNWEDMVNATAVTQALNMAETMAAIASGDPMAALQSVASNSQIQAAARGISVGPYSLNDFMRMDPNDLQGSLQDMAKDYARRTYPQYAGYADQLTNIKNMSPAEVKNLAVSMGQEAARSQTFTIGGVDMNVLQAGDLLNAPRGEQLEFLRGADIPGTNISIGNAYDTLSNPETLSLDQVRNQSVELAEAGVPGLPGVDPTTWGTDTQPSAETMRANLERQLGNSFQSLSGGSGSTQQILSAISGRDSSADSTIVNNITSNIFETAAPGIGTDLGQLTDLQNRSVFDPSNIGIFQESAGSYFDQLTGAVEGFPAQIGGRITEIGTSMQDIFTASPEDLQDLFTADQITGNFDAFAGALGLDPEAAAAVQSAMEAAQAMNDLQNLAAAYGDLGDLANLSDLTSAAQMANPVAMYIAAAQELNKLAGMFNLVATPEVKLDPMPNRAVERDLDYAVSVWFPGADKYQGSTDLMAVYLAEIEDDWYNQPTRWASRNDLLQRCPATGGEATESTGGVQSGGSIGGLNLGSLTGQTANDPSQTSLADPKCVFNWGSLEPASMFTPKSGNSLLDMSLVSYKAYRLAVERGYFVPTKIPENEQQEDYRATEINLEYPFNVDSRTTVGRPIHEWQLPGDANLYTDDVDAFVGGLRDAATQAAAQDFANKRDGKVSTLYKSTTCKVVTCCDVYPGFEPKEPWKIKVVKEFK